MRVLSTRNVYDPRDPRIKYDLSKNPKKNYHQSIAVGLFFLIMRIDRCAFSRDGSQDKAAITCLFRFNDNNVFNKGIIHYGFIDYQNK